MIKVDKLTKRLGLFAFIYIGLAVFSMWQPISRMHNVYFTKIGKAFFNAINITYHSEWSPKAPTNVKGWDTTIKLYDLEKHGSLISSKRYQQQTQPNRIVYNNFFTNAFLPLLFLLSLYIVTTNMKWTEKLWRYLISWLILNIFIAFHISHMIENVMVNLGEANQSFWQKTIALLGFYGLEEGLYIIAAISWAAMVLPKMGDWHKG